ncbi:MAG: branched-chain amino acid ABC transporter permease [Firmicutes bacterium]|nr:branched-chain amino acid ABC transporter permease [Bacillota bacterium]
MSVRVLQQLVNGVSIGFIYALIAVGYSLIYSILRFSNFAHASFLVVGAYSGFFLVTAASAPFVPAVLLAMLTAGGAAVVTERLAYRPIRERNSPTLYFIIASMGIAIFCEQTIIATIGPKFRTYPRVLQIVSVDLGKTTVGIMDVVAALMACLSLSVMQYFLSRTKTGFAIQAASFDLQAAGLMGVNVNSLVGFVFLIAGVLAGLSGVFLGMKYAVYPQLGYLTTKAFVGAIFGGLGSLPGAIVGSIALGLLETFVAAFISSQLRDVVVFILLIAVLLIRPSGLMGKSVEEKV